MTEPGGGHFQPLVLSSYVHKKISVILMLQEQIQFISSDVFKKYSSGILVTESQVQPFISLILNKKYLVKFK